MDCGVAIGEMLRTRIDRGKASSGGYRARAAAGAVMVNGCRMKVS